MTTDRFLLAGLSLLLIAMAVGSCATSDNSDSRINPGKGGSGADGQGGTGDGGSNPDDPDSSTTGGTGGLIPGVDASGDVAEDVPCQSINEDAVRYPLSLYIMFDKSSTMEGFRWESATQGLIAFLSDPRSAGISVGLNFFPSVPAPQQICKMEEYMMPATPPGFVELPEHAQELIDLINNAIPNGSSTPIYTAMGGAILKAMEINTAEQPAAVLLVTDGTPEGPPTEDDCIGVDAHNVDVITDVAALGLDNGVHTYVVGLTGADPAFCNQVAQAGGGEAIQVEGTDIQDQFQLALVAIRGQAAPCEFKVPRKVEDRVVDYDQVNVLLTPDGEEDSETIPMTDEDDCSEGGWYYDDEISHDPEWIVLCESTCERVRNDLWAKVEIELGCKTDIR